MKQNQSLYCILPWKAFCMEERAGRLSALPCDASWIKQSYGSLEDGKSLIELWNSPGAVEMRRLIVEGRKDDLCEADCPFLFSGRFSEGTVGFVPGPPEFEANQRLNNQEISERRTILRSLPVAVRIIPTLQCNIRCRMCHQDHDNDIRLPETFMPDVRKLGKYIYDYNIHGGELLISERFHQWVDPDWFAENPQMLLSLFTNATKIPKQTWDILECLRINYITVSINAATRETYKHITGSDLFHDVVQNIKALRELGRVHVLRKFQVTLSFVIMRCNYHELPAFANLAQQLELPFKLLIVTGNPKGESINNSPAIIINVLAALEKAWLLASEESRPQLNRVKESLLARLALQTLMENK